MQGIEDFFIEISAAQKAVPVVGILEHDRENVQRRLSVNDNMLGTLADSRRAAADWLRENLSLVPETGRERLENMAENCPHIRSISRASWQFSSSRASDCSSRAICSLRSPDVDAPDAFTVLYAISHAEERLALLKHIRKENLPDAGAFPLYCNEAYFYRFWGQQTGGAPSFLPKVLEGIQETCGASGAGKHPAPSAILQQTL